MFSTIKTPNRLPLRNVQNVTPTTKKMEASFKGTPKTSPGPALLQAIYLSNSKRMSPILYADKSDENKKKTEPITMSNNVAVSKDEHNILYFRDLLKTETDQLSKLCSEWEENISKLLNQINSSEDSLHFDTILGDIRTVIGQARLIMQQRFSQFEGLVDNSEFNTGEKVITCEDLQGFWDMIYFQVMDVNKKFENLTKLKENNWEPCEIKDFCNPPKRKKIVKKSIDKPSAAVTAKRQEMARKRLEARKRLQAAKAAMLKSATPQKSATATVTFDAGFFKIESPVKTAEIENKRKSLSGKKQITLHHRSKSEDDCASPCLTSNIHEVANVNDKSASDKPRKLNFSEQALNQNNNELLSKGDSLCKSKVEAKDVVMMNLPEKNLNEKERLLDNVHLSSVSMQTDLVSTTEKTSQTTKDESESMAEIVFKLLQPEAKILSSGLDSLEYKHHFYRLFAKVKLLEENLSSVKRMFHNMSQSKAKMERTFCVIKQWHRSVQEDLEDYKIVKNKYKEVEVGHQEELSKLKEKIAALQLESKELKHQNKELKIENEKIHGEIEVCKKENEDWMNKVSVLTNKAQEAIEIVTSELQISQDKNKALLSENLMLKENNHELQEKLEVLKYVEDECKSWEDQFRETDKNFQASTEDAQNLKKSLSLKQQESEKLQEKLNFTEESLEENKNALEYFKSNSYVMIRKREEEIKYSKSALHHILKMMTELNCKLLGLLTTGEDNQNDETDTFNVYSTKEPEEKHQDNSSSEESLSDQVESAAKMLQVVINTCASVQCQYKDQIEQLSTAQSLSEVKITKLQQELKENKNSDEELVLMLQKRITELTKQRDEKSEQLDERLRNTYKLNAEMSQLLVYKNKYLKLVSRFDEHSQTSHFTPYKSRRRSSSVGNDKNIRW